MELVSIEIRRELNRIPEAQVVVRDGDVAARRFKLSNAAFFEPGKRVTIFARYEGESEDVVLFEGLVLRHAIESRGRSSSLRVELKDAAFKLTRQRKSAVFHKQSDDETIRKLLDDAKLTVGDLEPTKTKHDEMVQYYASDWDFILSRADVQGLVVDVSQGKVSVRPMVPQDKPKLKLEYGIGPGFELELEIDGADQWAAMTSAGWDAGKLEPGEPSDAKDPSVKVGNLDPAEVARKLGGDTFTLLYPGTAGDGELTAWADARLARSRLSFLRGRLTVAGRADLAPLDFVELAGVGDRFDGKALISGVTQRIDNDGWTTELQLGLAPGWFAREPDIADVPAAGLLPPAEGLQIGVVGDFEKDPKGELRVKVLLSPVDKKQGAVWARMARPDAGNGRGFVHWPEPGDEVVVGFVSGDPRKAIILGALHGSKNKPPKAIGDPSKE
ncbi:MAG: type VI secretion system tip protein VgrG, partial [Myxococcales bacterium]|nr:type VI secretion system tip protein VgrG [Myxococcales bacterium]